MKFLTQYDAREAYLGGKILENRQNRVYITAFSLFGIHYTSTKKRAEKGKKYKLDSEWWCTPNEQGLLRKVYLILSGRVYRIRPT